MPARSCRGSGSASFSHVAEENEIQVEVTAQEDARWYSGAGIYRNVILVVGLAGATKEPRVH